MGNTLGTMIGYGMYSLGSYILLFRKKERCKKIWQMLLLQVPLILTVAMFATIFISYNVKELGNLSNGYVVKQKNISVTSEQNFDTGEETAMVYQTTVLTVEDTERIAKELFAVCGQGLDDSRTDIYENSAVYYCEDNHLCIWFEYDGGGFTYYDFSKSLLEEDSVSVKINATEEEIRQTLETMGIFIPANAIFEEKGEGIYRFGVEQSVENNAVYDGYIECEYYEDGSCGDIDYQILKLDEYKEVSILSEQEAYHKIEDGQFVFWSQSEETIDVRVLGVTRGYELDTKGFYQPVYFFDTQIDGQKMEIFIPAIP